jgi:hypothetical protein
MANARLAKLDATDDDDDDDSKTVTKLPALVASRQPTALQMEIPHKVSVFSVRSDKPTRKLSVEEAAASRSACRCVLSKIKSIILENRLGS